MSPHHFAHDPTIEEAIGAVTHVLARFRDMQIPDSPAAEAAYRGAALDLIEMIADAVEERLKRRKEADAVMSAVTQIQLARESHRLA